MNILSIPKLVSQFLGAQKDVYTQDIVDIILSKDNYLNEFSNSENSVKLIFDHVNSRIVYISDNAEAVSGYPVNNFYKLGLPFIFQIFNFQHYDVFYRWWKWAYDTHLKYNISVRSKEAMCGVKLTHKDGHTIRMLFRQMGIKSNDKGITTVSVFTLDDVTHLMKADFYWGRMVSKKEDETLFFHMVSTEKKDKPTDILTDREKEIVRLLAQGKESKEIGSLLFVSPHTVDNHRRNMIAKIGVRDTTGLVQICRMVGII